MCTFVEVQFAVELVACRGQASVATKRNEQCERQHATEAGTVADDALLDQ